MNDKHNADLTELSKALRRNMTPEERHLWYDFLKELPVTFHRQKIVGRYILDFYCARAGLAIELDGGQHYEEETKQQDALRDQFLQERGIAVLRYSNLEVHRNFEGVCCDIARHLEEKGIPCRKRLPLEGKLSGEA